MKADWKLVFKNIRIATIINNIENILSSDFVLIIAVILLLQEVAGFSYLYSKINTVEKADIFFREGLI